MRNSFYTEHSQQLIFTAFDSVKSHKTDLYRTHYHTELEIGYIISGRGDYVLNGEHFDAKPNDLFLVRANEQHCVPTIYSDELVSFNLHITSYYLWNICSEYIRPEMISLITGDLPIPHCFNFKSDIINDIMELAENPADNRFKIRRLVLLLIEMIAQELESYSHNVNLPTFTPSHLDDIQNAIAFINTHLGENITLDEIAKNANLSRSHLSSLFKGITGVSPYEYLLLQRVERAVSMINNTDSKITDIAYEFGFFSQANFNKSFRRITGMSPSTYRKSRQNLR